MPTYEVRVERTAVVETTTTYQRDFVVEAANVTAARRVALARAGEQASNGGWEVDVESDGETQSIGHAVLEVTKLDPVTELVPDDPEGP